jgi:GNAT superfamily N-acetyltransferase
MADPSPHPLGDILRRAALGDPPPPDGSVTFLEALPGPVDAVCSFTAHHVVAVDLAPDEVRAHLPEGDLVAPMAGEFLAWVAERLGSRCGPLDAVLVTFGERETPPAALSPVDGSAHPRATRAARYRTDLRMYGDERGRGVLVLGRGLAGRWEMSFEVEPEYRGRGVGRTLAAAARRLVPNGQPLFAQVAPGNVASLRSLLAAGYRPIGSEVLFPRS